MTDRKIDWWRGGMILSILLAMWGTGFYIVYHPAPDPPPNAQVNAQRAEHAYIIPLAEAQADEQSLRTRLDYADAQLADKGAEIAALRKEAVEYKHKTQDIWDNFAALQKENARLKKFEPPHGCVAQPAYCGPVYAPPPAFGKDAPPSSELPPLKSDQPWSMVWAGDFCFPADKGREVTLPLHGEIVTLRCDGKMEHFSDGTESDQYEWQRVSKDAAPPKEPQ
jgi:hypothetical protein